MTDEPKPKKQKKPKAKFFDPPNVIKKKVGFGGLPDAILARAQDVIDKNTIDFDPIGREYMDELIGALALLDRPYCDNTQKIFDVMHPIIQMKSSGGMFHYPSVTMISDIVVKFIETTGHTDSDVIDLLLSYKTAVDVILKNKIKLAEDPRCTGLAHELSAACERYTVKHNA